MSADGAPRGRRRRAARVLWLGPVLAALAFPVGTVGAIALHPRPATAHGVSVQTMVVGPGGVVVARARTVLAGATHVRVGGRSCAVAPSTPLAVLVALRNAGGPAFTLRDYGHCDGSAADSSQLFVNSVGGRRNSGQNGWVYEVDGVAGSTGAADPSGPLGNGRRLAAGAKVLWFYCRMGVHGCQRTLGVVAEGGAVTAGAAFTVTVTGSDEQGRGTPVQGATVTLGPSSALTASDGVATVTIPSAPGSYQLTASAPGTVPSFPVGVQVR